MKKGLRVKLFAFALALCLCTTMVTPAFAASGRYNSFGNRWSFSNWWNNRWNHDDDNTSDSNKSDSSETKLKLVEDQSTVAEGTELRASTYKVENTDAASNTSTIKYFPVTMYNYDTKKINKATHNAEAAKAYANEEDSISSWDGMYFSGGNPVNGASNSKYNTSAYLGDNIGKAGKKSYSTETYAKWNYWGADVKNAGYTGNYICSGLVEKSLDKSNNIVFTNTEPGLFRSDDTTNSYGKKIYTNVGLPFQYDKTTNYYTLKYVDATANGATFSYKFTGTGTSFFARTTNNSGYMRVTVYDSANKKVYTGYRDTSYKTDDKSTTLYNIPVFTWNATEYGEYTVKVSIAKKTGNYGTDFWLDGIRVMNPMNPDSGNLTIAQDAYAADGESNMTFATLRNALLADTRETENGELVWDTSKGFVVFTDSNGAITSASEYKSNGPKEEVYLAKDQSVSFSLTDWNANENHLYLGIKAPMGAGTVQLGDDDDSVAVNNTVDCYYDVAKHAKISEVNGKKVATLTITNNSNSIISLTNIKVTGTPNFVIIPEKNADNVVPDEAED